MGNDRDYVFHQYTLSYCVDCRQVVRAKVVTKDGSVFLMKQCPVHGLVEDILEHDAEYYVNRYKYDKPGSTCKTQTAISDKGCPYDCGLCPDHEQHTCIGLIEVTDKCNLKCPLCYAYSGEGASLDMDTIEKMMDFYQDSEHGKAEILQISGGEPTVHPQILDIIRLAREKKFKYVMLNTNGLRIASDDEFVKQLAEFSGGFEIYLQFDGLSDRVYQKIRGRDLLDIKMKAIERLGKYKIPITLVSTIQHGVNTDEIGGIVQMAMANPTIRGVNFQPVALFGRLNGASRTARTTMTSILHDIDIQTKGMVRVSDFIPLPCDVERIAVTFLYRDGDEFIPLMRSKEMERYIPLINNTFAFNAKDVLKDAALRIIQGDDVCNCFKFLKDIMPLTPPAKLMTKPKKLREAYVNDNTFRISVTSFVDGYNFEIKAVKKECVHIITPDLKKYPFSMYNLIHRKPLAQYGIK